MVEFDCKVPKKFRLPYDSTSIFHATKISRVLYDSRGNLSDLLSGEFRKLTVLLWSIWTGASFIYYGVVLMTTELFETPGSHGVCTLDGALKVQCSAQVGPQWIFDPLGPLPFALMYVFWFVFEVSPT